MSAGLTARAVADHLLLKQERITWDGFQKQKSGAGLPAADDMLPMDSAIWEFFEDTARDIATSTATARCGPRCLSRRTSSRAVSVKRLTSWRKENVFLRNSLNGDGCRCVWYRGHCPRSDQAQHMLTTPRVCSFRVPPRSVAAAAYRRSISSAAGSSQLLQIHNVDAEMIS